MENLTGLRRLTRTRLSQTKAKTQQDSEGLNETVRNQRENSINQINQSKTSLDESVTPKPMWPKLAKRRLDKDGQNFKKVKLNQVEKGRNKEG